ncbi:hypothetical protein FRC07_013745 [Ceratobasidium sp. 392]|nr:hypothetical protein FRC07_013745 [Ceratobasidium sp. 392]
MHNLKVAFVTIIALCTSAFGAKHLPGYKHLYSWTAELSEVRQIQGSLGTRIGVGLLGGNMMSPDGRLIAKAVPGLGGDTGLVDKNGNVQADARLFFQFLDDGKYAYMVTPGIGSFTGQSFDAVRIETDSVSRAAWNGYFLVANVSLSSPTLLRGDAFVFSTGA